MQTEIMSPATNPIARWLDRALLTRTLREAIAEITREAPLGMPVVIIKTVQIHLTVNHAEGGGAFINDHGTVRGRI